SVAAYKAVHIASALVQAGASVTTVMTANAMRFVTPLTFQTVTRREVIADLWDSTDTFDAEHVALAKSAECVVVAPATANILAKAALGIADDALSCLLMTTKAPVIYAPAMNSGMFLAPALQRNIKTLVELGCEFVGPAEGRLADGSKGIGRMADPEEILAVVERVLG
ncbi:MAG: bifunctional 4'-phosphopantothenoylcysteine decarboxylase/phosphopantothenoylcysteine synthetase, partial [Planctomycetes bacterium]|nr:bifunctional 4'-phosphopantothenoylcysteine decarboxylase/phosphopantothenoylcysteine synthetase [Planctomycetota bacterium]